MTHPDGLWNGDEPAKRLGEMGDVFDRPPPEVSARQLAFEKLAAYDKARAEARLLRDMNRLAREKLD